MNALFLHLDVPNFVC